ncbi:MAG: class I SAM-dependent methyltransferase [Bacteroidota bacterium]
MDEQIAYYAKRAKEYDQVYLKPERQEDLADIKARLSRQFPAQHLLEIACGTGWWTQYLAQAAQQITATDINASVLSIAQTRKYGCPVQFIQADIWEMEPKNHDALFGGFIWSHIRREQLADFADLILQQIQSGSHFVFLDNRFVPGSSTPISETDLNGNTLQKRSLQNGESFSVVKNFPDFDEMQRVFGDRISNPEWIEWQYFWLFAAKRRA